MKISDIIMLLLIVSNGAAMMLLPLLILMESHLIYVCLIWLAIASPILGGIGFWRILKWLR